MRICYQNHHQKPFDKISYVQGNQPVFRVCLNSWHFGTRLFYL